LPDDDNWIYALTVSASDSIDRFCNRYPDGFRANGQPETRIYSGNGKAWLYIEECARIVSVSVKASPGDTTYTAWATSDWIAFSGDVRKPNFNGTPYHGILVNPNGSYSVFTSGAYRGLNGFPSTVDANPGYAIPTVQIVANWGYSFDTPASVKEACIIQCVRWYKRGQSAWADTIASADVGQLQFKKSLDPDVAHLLIEGRMVKVATGMRY
jgi:hypothetical protein